MINLSKTSKLGCKSWSLEAGSTCPGSFDKMGSLVPACAGCYAKSGNYRFPNVKAPREENKQDWRRDEWVNDMVSLLKKETHFRWFDSGDMYHLELAKKILDVMKLTPNTKHWLPTRMYKFAKFVPVLTEMKELANVMVRYSSDSVMGEFDEIHGSTIIPEKESAKPGVDICLAYENEGKCNGCRKCWDKDIPVIGYIAHGRSMKKVIRIALAA